MRKLAVLVLGNVLALTLLASCASAPPPDRVETTTTTQTESDSRVLSRFFDEFGHPLLAIVIAFVAVNLYRGSRKPMNPGEVATLQRLVAREQRADPR